MSRIVESVQINMPFNMLVETYLERFIAEKLNPEIGFDAKVLDQHQDALLKSVASRLHIHGLEITLHAPFMDLSPGSPDDRIRSVTRKRFEQLLEAIEIFKPKSVVCHTGYDAKRYREMRKEWLQRSLEFWSWFSHETAKRGTLLMLENVYEKDPEDMVAFFEQLDGRKVGFCLDTGHQAAFSRTPLEKWVNRLISRLGQVHLHDNNGTWDEHLGLGKGNIDFLKLFKMLKEEKREPPIFTLEPHKEEDLRISLHYLDGIWPW